MTVSANLARKVITGAGWSNPLTFAIYIESSSHIEVWADDVLLALGTDYTVAGVADPTGFEVTILTPASYTSVTSWVLLHKPPLTQGADLSAGGAFGLAYENAADAMTRRMQAIDERAQRALKLPLTSPGTEDFTDRVPLGRADGTFDVGPTAAQISGASASAAAAAASAAAAAASAAAAAASAANIVSVPAGGSTSQVLSKVSNTNYDLAWITAPLLNAANIWTAAQTITSALAGATLLALVSTDAGASGGPQLDLLRNSASAAASDIAGVIRFRGMNSSASELTYGNINSTILDPTAGSEAGRLILQVPVAGVQISALSVANGVIVGAPTGSYKGTGTLNATGYYRNGTELSSTLFGVAVGDASGNLKVLNTDGAWTFATTATSTNVAGVNVGAWKTAHRILSTDAATYSGSRNTMTVMREYTGSGENGPTRADTALQLELKQTDYLNNTTIGEGDTLRIFNQKGRNGDGAAMLLNMTKVESASYGGILWEGASAWVQAGTGTILRLTRLASGHHGPAADLRGGGNGSIATAMIGDHATAFIAIQDHTDTGRWKYPFLAADGYLNGDEYFYVTGPAHASGKGKLYTSGIAHIAATVAAPAGGGSTGMIAIGNVATFGIYFGTGAPTVSAAKGSLYLRRDGTTTNNRAYINTDGGTTWTAFTTVA